MSLAAVVLLAAPVVITHTTGAEADSSKSLSFRASRPETGWIGVTVRGEKGSSVIVQEQAGSALEHVTRIRLRARRVHRRHVLPWRCDRRQRALVATAMVNGAVQRATARVKTPSCRNRLDGYVRPARPRAGGRVYARLVDTWGTGNVEAQACIATPGVEQDCADARIDVSRARSTASFAVTRTGRSVVDITTPWGQRLRRQIDARGAGEKLRVLATGDSMVQYVDTSLSKRLEPGGDVSVRSDARVSTGISKLSGLDWVQHARGQAGGFRPDATVVFIGANDGFPLRAASRRKKVRCCGRAWVKAYSLRARQMMAAYARRGAGQVYWLTLPAPRPTQWRNIYAAVNRALRRAASRFGDEVKIVDLGKVFTPGWRFRRTMRWHGQTVVVRQGDGVHLTAAGASIAAELVNACMRAGHALE